ncbi:fasciclin [Aliidiomarina iranensis]|uniref:Fasciclin n=1 Tax=Aliidiomarina iranensis TaxID=1434071 RepID=A0A432VW92_9GAMM|nr:fasciclin domain-containing protein [Aliidiomarina iranensis]RUO20838.1 fasciclin [Aliidiomarina iranensis]
MSKLTTLAMSIALAGSFAVSGLAIADHHGGNKERSGYSQEEKKGTIAEIAASNGSFGTLVAALDAADLVDVLNGEGPFTVFAPTDEAFAALPEGTVESLLEPENRDQLVAVLTYHVVSGKVMSGDLAGQQMSADTVEGSALNIDATGYGVKINDASVVTADIEADNGVIHVIDTVLIPGS